MAINADYRIAQFTLFADGTIDDALASIPYFEATLLSVLFAGPAGDQYGLEALQLLCFSLIAS